MGCHFLLQGSCWLRDPTRVSCISCIGRLILFYWAIWETLSWSPPILKELTRRERPQMSGQVMMDSTAFSCQDHCLSNSHPKGPDTLLGCPFLPRVPRSPQTLQQTLLHVYPQSCSFTVPELSSDPADYPVTWARDLGGSQVSFKPTRVKLTV